MSKFDPFPQPPLTSSERDQVEQALQADGRDTTVTPREFAVANEALADSEMGSLRPLTTSVFWYSLVALGLASFLLLPPRETPGSSCCLQCLCS